MLGALYRVAEFLDPEEMKKVIRATFGEKYPQLVEANIRTFDRGFNEVKFQTFEAEEGNTSEFIRATPLLGYKTQPLGGNIINPGNTIKKDLSGSRQGYIPEFNIAECISCANCDIVCPDLCFTWEEKEDSKGRPQMFLQGIDYKFCKGCLKCVEACPTNALKTIREVEGYTEEHSVSQKFKLASN